MITIFSTPKNFNGKFKTIQLNAIRSWRNLSSDIQIIILGNSKDKSQLNIYFNPSLTEKDKAEEVERLTKLHSQKFLIEVIETDNLIENDL